jgi:exopolysaccharide biosynthesis polyprenyl glycosylphosphotransferase
MARSPFTIDTPSGPGRAQAQTRNGHRDRVPRPRAPGDPPVLADPLTPRGRYTLRSWMLVTPVDIVMTMLPALWAPQHVKAMLAMTVISQLMLTNGRRYCTRLHVSVLDELPWFLVRLLTATTVVATVTALRHEQEAVTSFLIAALAAVALFIVGRVISMQIVLFGRRRRVVVHRTLLVGGGPLASEIAAILARYPQYGLVVEGFVDSGRQVDAGASIRRLGSLCDIDAIVRERHISTALVTSGDFADDELVHMVRQVPIAGCQLLVVPRLCQLNMQVGLPDHIGSIPVMRISKPSLRGPAWTVKRGFDVVVSVVALVVLSPLLLLCAIAVWIDGGSGGILFRQQRVGRNGQVFDCLKFRSMKPADPRESATQWSIANDGRLGGVGRVLRRLSLDELPQLWNILRGDMTLVGPRPERPHFVRKFSAEIPQYDHRHRVRAGLTGLAQVSGLRGDTSIADRARFDNYYIENWSLWMDAKIILRTFGAVLMGGGR